MPLRRLILTCLAFTLATPAFAAGPVCDGVWSDAARQGRQVPVRIRMPDGTGNAPMILFSHGLGGSLDAGTDWAKAWADAGFIVIHLQHAGSDTAAVRASLAAAQGGEQLVARANDVHFVIDEVGRRKREGACDLTRIDRAHIGMSGHSFGALTTEVVAGENFAAGMTGLADKRVQAAIAFSPSPSRTLGDAEAFGTITMAFLSFTGTADAVPRLNNVTPADRQRPFHAMPPGGKYLLVYQDATHMMFGGRGAAPPAISQSVIAASTLFWKAMLRGDAAAKRQLDAFGATVPPGTVFEKK